ncbi:MAG: hypothetical protein KGJ93_00910 [Patescibacteria group bacterium]|nr:hypothetical protein [Patescibacteria group bacterium]
MRTNPNNPTDPVWPIDHPIRNSEHTHTITQPNGEPFTYICTCANNQQPAQQQ